MDYFKHQATINDAQQGLVFYAEDLRRMLSSLFNSRLL